MEEHNQPLPCPIAGEPATPAFALGGAVTQHYHGLMALRATMAKALTDWDNIGEAYHNRGQLMDAMGDFNAAIEQALIQVDTLLGLEQPTENASEGLTHEDGDFIMAQDAQDPYAGDAEGEMRAEAEAERQADAALELAAELASCDWEGWN